MTSGSGKVRTFQFVFRREKIRVTKLFSFPHFGKSHSFPRKLSSFNESHTALYFRFDTFGSVGCFLEILDLEPLDFLVKEEDQICSSGEKSPKIGYNFSCNRPRSRQNIKCTFNLHVGSRSTFMGALAHPRQEKSSGSHMYHPHR